MRALSFYRTMKSVFAWLPLLVCLPLRTFGSGVKATEKVETGYLLSCISTCGAAVGGRPALVWVKPSREVFFPLSQWEGALGRVEGEDPQRNCSLHSYTWLGRQMVHVKTTAVIAEQRHPLCACVRARATALLERCRSVLALSRRQQRRHHKTSKR